jgi:superfamily II DNA or RNA helicase
MGAKSRAAALGGLRGPPLLAVATGSYAGEGSDCPALDTLFLAAPVASKGSLTQYPGQILRSHQNKTTAEVHDHLDERTGVLAARLGRAQRDPRPVPLRSRGT